MNKRVLRPIIILSFIITIMITVGCSIKYSFTGASIPEAAKTISIAPIENVASMVVPGLASQLTEALQDKFTRQTRLKMVPEDGDFSFEGTIVNYTSNPMAVTGNEYASMNRLTITIKITFNNKIVPKDSFSRQFSAYEDYDSNKLMQEVEPTLLPQIIEKLVDDVFNQSVSNWN